MSYQKDHKINDHGEESEWKKMKLVSIAFKEASLDTPSFRSSVNYFQTRIEIFEEWIEKIVDYMDNKYSASVDDFQRAHNTFISLLLPSPIILSNGFVANQVNTPSLVGSFNNSYHDLCSKIFKLICEKDFGCPNALLELMNTAIEPYKDKRATFDFYQTKYDNILGKYQGIKISNTDLEPSTIREDAFQVFEVRKEYLKSSLELICAISTMKLAIDKFLLEVMESIQSKINYPVKELGTNVDLAPSITSSLHDYSNWIKNAAESSKILSTDMQHAKQQVTDYSISKMSPSREINDYNVKSISFSTLTNKKAECPKSSPEKFGWLYMKTTVGSPSRTVWVRRWCFLKNSVFGLFLLSSSKTCVEETDKFGILLTSIRYDPDEDRKFCFEVKIIDNRLSEAKANISKDIHLVFQTESLQELRSWLNVFEGAKSYAFNLDHESIEYDMAFKRYPPEFLEFACSTTTTTDQLITTCDENTISIMEAADYELANFYMESSSGHKFLQFQLAVTPISTKLTQMAIVANLYKKGYRLPNAMLANIWGSANWSDYALYDKAQEHVHKTTNKSQRSSGPLTVANYPAFYPQYMKVNDIQFKSLFFTINQKLEQFPDELLLFNFSAFWCPNKRQKFSANCYVTVDHLYCYMNSMGFICLTHRSLADLVSIEVDESADNLLKIYDVNGVQLKMYVFFVDLQLLAAKMQYLLENKALTQPKNEEEIMKKLSQMDMEFQDKLKKAKLAASKVAVSNPPEESFSSTLCRSFWSTSATAIELAERRRSIQRKCSVMYRHPYEVPSKCLMHLLYGDQSTAFPRSLFLATKDNDSNINGVWTETESRDGQSELVRELEFTLNMTDSFLHNLQVGDTSRIKLNQRIVRMIENRYYEVDQDPVIIKTPFCRPLRVSVKHLIIETHESQSALENSSSSCLLYIFYYLEFINSTTGKPEKNYTLPERMILTWATFFTSSEYMAIRRIIRYYLEKIGKHGKIIKAIKVCGMIGVAKNAKEEADHQQSVRAETLSAVKNEKDKFGVEVVYSTSIVFKVILKTLGYKITNMTFVFIRLVFAWLLVMVSNVTHINRTLLLGLLMSIILNVFLSGRSTLAYWSVKRAESSFDHYMADANENMIQRSISIKDLDLLSFNLAFESDNQPFKKFNETRSAETYQYKASRNELSTRRKDLLVELKILQNMERELVQDQYKKFLLSELEKCELIREEVFELWENDTQLNIYCENCRGELYRLSTLLL